MATIQQIERQIERLEGFRVTIRYVNPGPSKGRDVRGDRRNLPPYPKKRAMPSGRVVRDWVDIRFKRNYPGFEVDVLRKDGTAAHGRTLLDNVRATYD